MNRAVLPWAGALLLAAALAGAYGIYWKIVHDRAVALLGEQADVWRAAGYEVAWSEMATGGFPLAVEAVLEQPRVASPPGEAPWRWSADRLRVGLRPWSLNVITLEPEGRHHAATSVHGALEGEAQDLRITLDADSLGVRRMTVTSGPAAVVARSDGATLAAAEALALHAERDGGSSGSYRLVASAERPEWRDAREAEAESASLDAEATALDVLAARGALDGPALAAWAAAGGALTVHDARLDWGDAEIGARGALRLDRYGRWNGQVELDTRAPSRAFVHLAALGAVDPEAARQASALAGALESGADDRVSLPLTVREGEVYALGMVRLGHVAPAF